MISTAEPDASWQEDTMTWLTTLLRNGIGFTFLGEYLSYGIHILWLLVPFILAYSVLIFIYCFACLVNLLIYIYKKMNNIQGDPHSESWDKMKKAVAYIVISYAKIWHGTEVIGMENVPDGPGLIIYYHGPVPYDYVTFVWTLYSQTGRMCCSVCHHIFCSLPGINLFRYLSMAADYSKAECVKLLKSGQLLGIAPGGLREVNFSDKNYTLVWGNRTGFAEVALEAKVPIIPMFTQNIREAYCTVGNTRLIRWFYEHNRWLILPIFGGFPVKLRVYIGEPILYDPNITAKELADKTKTAIENLRDQYQKRPGNTIRAVLERFDKHHKDN